MRLVQACVNYSDHLQHTLPLWADLVGAGNVMVVTSPEDEDTQRVAEHHGIDLCITRAWTQRDPYATRDLSHWHAFWTRRGIDFRGRPVFNKAFALDQAFGFLPGSEHAPAPGEICIVADADVRPVGRLPADCAIKDGVLYGCKRYELNPCGSRGELMVVNGRATLKRTQHRRNWFVCQGYFQLFRWHPGMRFGSYPAADGYDDDFAHDFARGEEVPNFYVLHQGDMSTTHTNWAGRKTDRFEVQA